MDPLPGDNLPADQTVEGGAQIRVTPSGFATLTALVPGLIGDSIGDTCISGGGFSIDILGIGLGSVDYCDGNPAGPCGNNTCEVAINVDSVDMSVPADDIFNIRTQFDVNVPIDIHGTALCAFGSCVFDETCTLTGSLNNTVFDANIRFGIRNSDGELTMSLDQINDIDLSGFGFSGCGAFGSTLNALANIISGILDSFIGDFIIDLVTPLINDLIQGFLPDPLGIEGTLDMGTLFGGFSPGTNASMEMRVTPGGYVFLENGGLSLGMITGINADEDTATRGADLDSEPALCVPPLAAPDFSQPPASLTTVARSAIGPGDPFVLDPANEFRGIPDPAAVDIVMGASETFLDLTGHHLVTSGAMCLGVGTNLSDQLTLGTIGILVPSLAALGEGDGDEPLLLVTRPQTPLDFTIGAGTATDPSLTIHINNFEVDFYAFIFERYVRGFTMALDMDVGINLEFTTDANGDPAILPTLVGLESDMIGVTVLNSEFLEEDDATLEAVLPTVFDLALPLLADGLDPIALPEFAGFSLTNLTVGKVMTLEDDFLAINATLGPGSMMANLADRFPSVEGVLAEMPVFELAPPAMGAAELRSVTTPKPDVVIAGLMNEPGGALPEVVIDVAKNDDMGRPLEWTWNIDGGMWRQFSTERPLIIRDRAFSFQGKYEIELLSRVVGDYTTLDPDPVTFPVVIDSVGPRIDTDEVEYLVSSIKVTARDLVSKDAVELAFAGIDAQRPETEWGDGTIAFTDLGVFVGRDMLVQVFARDELGNESTALVDLNEVLNFHGSANDGGCNCAVGGASGATWAGYIALFGLTALLIVVGPRRRRRRTASRRRAIGRKTVRKVVGTALVVVALGLAPACSCGGEDTGITCEVNEDCIAECPENTVPLCFENQCLCADDVPIGRIGQYSAMSLSANGSAWVSAYNSLHGDLMVANFADTGRIPDEDWEFIDGVPDGPIIVEDSDVRGGIFEPGENVGLYTDITVSTNDIPMISYFDEDRVSLKFAGLYAGVWETHHVEVGSPMGDPELGFEVFGQYTAITSRTDDGRPGIAYFVQSASAGEVTTQVRYAEATTPEPRAGSDWTIHVVESAIVPMSTTPDPLTIPDGTGLFVNVARKSDQSPVLVYYDRINGDLKMAEFDANNGSFNTPVILDGDAGGDVGWYPGVGIDDSDAIHVSYVSATNDDLMYVNSIDLTPELVDDGYRIVGTTTDGLPKPEFHLVGDDSSVSITTAGPVATYQDATSHELLYAQKDSNGVWQRTVVAGDEDPFAGGYGFYADSEWSGQDIVMSTWVVDQPTFQVWVEIFRQTVVIQ